MAKLVLMHTLRRSLKPFTYSVLCPPTCASFAAAAAVLHTSASLTINENASPDVPLDLNVRQYITCLLT